MVILWCVKYSWSTLNFVAISMVIKLSWVLLSLTEYRSHDVYAPDTSRYSHT